MAAKTAQQHFSLAFLRQEENQAHEHGQRPEQRSEPLPADSDY
jgi:hypothetical protein